MPAPRQFIRTPLSNRERKAKVTHRKLCSMIRFPAMMNRMKSAVSSLLRILFALLLVGIAMLLIEDDLIYQPERDIATTPATAGLPWRDVAITASDGVQLHGWFIPAARARYTLLHFHGNAGNISHRLHLYRQWHTMGLNILAIDYRGYGKSDGAVSEAGLYRDAKAAWRHLTGAMNTAPSQIIISGRSLGAAVASRLAADKPAAGLVLETPFTSIRAMAAEHYPWLPARFFTRNRLDTLAHIRRLTLPLLIIAATEDTIVPLAMPQQIHAAAIAPKQLVQLAGNHNSFDIVSRTAYIAAWQQWLKQLDEHRK